MEENSANVENNASAILAPGAMFAGRYTIEAFVAAGGMGTVYRATDAQLGGHTVALKVLHPQFSADGVVFKRFVNEVLVARNLTHPHIIRIHDIGHSSEGAAYLTMEFVEGQSLSDWIFQKHGDPHEPKDAKALSSKDFAQVRERFLQILDGVDYAQRQGVIHRDLKPANILITKKGELKIGDFGTARMVGAASGITVEGQSMVGTPHYMSPEQIRGEALDHSCDIYALGMLGYELAIGKPPFFGIPPVAVAYKQVNEAIPPFAGSKTGVPGWFQEVIFKATAKDKHARYQSVAEMRRDILAQNFNTANPAEGELKTILGASETIQGIVFKPRVTSPLSRALIAIGLSVLALVCGLLVYQQTRDEGEPISIGLSPLEVKKPGPAQPKPESPSVQAQVSQESISSVAATESKRTDRGLNTADPAVRQPTTGIAALPQEQPYAIAGKKVYHGILSKPISGDTAMPSRNIELKFTLNGEKVFGSARIEGLGDFSANGQRNEKGLDVILKNSTTTIRLSGTWRQAKILRGTYFIPLSNSRGAFQATE